MENQIIELEKKYWEGMEKHDFDIVKSLTHFTCITAGKNGIRNVDEASFKKMFDSSEGVKWKVNDLAKIKTQSQENCAIIAYRIDLETTIDGKNTSKKCVCTSTWIKENNHWVCAMHTETDLAKNK